MAVNASINEGNWRLIKMQITDTENKFLNSLVQDCVTFHLNTSEALEYIQARYKQISKRSYERRKSFIQSDRSIDVWINYFTRIGFIQHHKEQIEIVQFIQNDSIQRLDIEKRKQPRNEDRIDRLKTDIRENVKLLSELGLGTPIVAAIRSKLQRHIQKSNAIENENESLDTDLEISE